MRPENYMRNYLFIGHELIHHDSHGRHNLSLVTQTDGGSAKQRELIKLAMPIRTSGNWEEVQLDARSSQQYISHTPPDMLTDYFFGNPSEHTAELFLPLLIQVGSIRTNMLVEWQAGANWPGIFFESDLVLAVLRMDNSGDAGSIYIADKLVADCLAGASDCVAVAQWVERAFLASPIVIKYCAMCAKPPAVQIEGVTMVDPLWQVAIA